MLFKDDLIKIYANMDYLSGRLAGSKGAVEDAADTALGVVTSHITELFSGIRALSRPETEKEKMLREFRDELAIVSKVKRNDHRYLKDRRNVAVEDKEIVEAVRFFKVFDRYNVKGKQGRHFNIVKSLLVKDKQNQDIYDNTKSWVDDYEDRLHEEKYGS
jgi:hypothetical protein